MGGQTDPEEAEARQLLGEIQRLERCRRDHLERFARLLQGRIFGWVRLITGQHADASEATQQTLAQIVSSVSTYDTEKPAMPWLKTIAIRVAYEVVRKRSR